MGNQHHLLPSFGACVGLFNEWLVRLQGALAAQAWVAKGWLFVWWGWRKVVSGACMPELSYLLPCMWPLTLKGLLIRRQGGHVMDGGIHFLP